ncbi:MAG: hypothetical protein HBSAPP04_27240 [Ignavibacteriaceae bacterium]|nr:MAG: hypothetical protein HBSAPP04_27240 [Ignavibacteriaceae bacterium]
MDANFEFLTTLLQLGWPAIVLIECYVLYKDNIKLRDLLIEYLNNCLEEDLPTDTEKVEIHKPDN